MTTFFSYNALVSQRASGYKNTTYALAELIDNAFDAEASQVTIVILEKRVNARRRVDEILVVDNGSGMEGETLQGALQFGNTTNGDIDAAVKKRKKGKFGYGLPNASLSQCPSIHVYSWRNPKAVKYVYLDLEELKQSESIQIPPIRAEALPSYYEGVVGGLTPKGTLVAWRKCDRLSHTKGETIVRNSLPVLGRLYRHLLANGKKIEFKIFEYNETRRTYVAQEAVSVRPNDPLFLMPNTQIAAPLWKEGRAPGASDPTKDHFAKYAISELECLPTNKKFDNHCYEFDFEWKGRQYEFRIITSVAFLDIQKPGVREGGHTKVGAFYGEKEREGNISFVRADREIASGNFGFYSRGEVRHRWWSIEIQFNADADDLLGLHNNKQGIEFTYTSRENVEDGDNLFNPHTAELLQAREHLWHELTLKLVSAQKDAFKQVKKHHSEWDAQHLSLGGSTSTTPQMPQSTATTQSTIKKVDGPRPNQLKPEQRTELEKRLIEKYSNINPDDIRAAVSALDQSRTRACILYAPMESTQLWTYTKIFDVLVVSVNSNHEFYSRFLGELRALGQDGALTSVELFLSSLAVEEEKFSTDDQAKDIIEDYRGRVGSHLHRYIKSLPEEMSIIQPSAAADGDGDE